MGTADHTGCGVQHSLQFDGRRIRRTRQDIFAVVNAQLNERSFVASLQFLFTGSSVARGRSMIARCRNVHFISLQHARVINL